jgi:exodeoxyribonuclease VII small subunit
MRGLSVCGALSVPQPIVVGMTGKPDSTQRDDLAALGYEQARDELVVTVQKLEAGGLSLEDSLTLWERGEALATHCQAKLDGVRARLDAVLAADPAAD